MTFLTVFPLTSPLTSEDLHQFLRSRRSVRRFRQDPIPREILDGLIETAVRAPSAHNRQPWRFAVLTTPEAREDLAAAMGAEFRRDLLADGVSPQEADRQVQRSRERITSAPAAVVLCLTMAGMDRYPDPDRRKAEFRMAMQSVALAGGQLLLAAHAEGLGGVWVCAPLFAQGAVQRALDLPEDWEPQGMVLLGRPDGPPAGRDRRPVAEVARFL
ncbi:MAG TPA: nitroreductase family protein [Anaerolineales bacterium]|nr:nitroreductase family protein [Anaerolineales bacterium]